MGPACRSAFRLATGYLGHLAEVAGRYASFLSARKQFGQCVNSAPSAPAIDAGWPARSIGKNGNYGGGAAAAFNPGVTDSWASSIETDRAKAAEQLAFAVELVPMWGWWFRASYNLRPVRKLETVPRPWFHSWYQIEQIWAELRAPEPL